MEYVATCQEANIRTIKREQRDRTSFRRHKLDLKRDPASIHMYDSTHITGLETNLRYILQEDNVLKFSDHLVYPDRLHAG